MGQPQVRRGPTTADVACVFKLTPEGKEIVLYSFCAQTTAPMGQDPLQGWSSTRRETCMGRPQAGSLRGGHTEWHRIQAYSKRQGDSPVQLLLAGYNCTDGANPYAGLVFDRKGNLYGTTVNGGADTIASTRGAASYSSSLHDPMSAEMGVGAQV